MCKSLKPSKVVLQAVQDHWALSGELKFVRKVENWIYYAPQEKVYIRLTEPSHRKKSEIESELDWLKHLENSGVLFAHPVAAKREEGEKREIGEKGVKGRKRADDKPEGLVKRVFDATSEYFVSVFREAEGRPLKSPEDFTNEVFTSWGRSLGKIHQASKAYVPGANIVKRDEWNTDRNFREILASMHPSQGGFYRKANEVIEMFASFPKSERDYGLVHADFHRGNFHVNHRNDVIAFDFDDCHYHWFAYDVGTVFFSLEKHEYLQPWREAEHHFWMGYDLENEMDSSWKERVGIFSDYRVIVVYFWCLRNLKTPTLNSEARNWMINKMKWCEHAMA